MKVKIPASKLIPRWALNAASTAVLLAISAPGLHAQSIGVNFTSNGNASGIANAETDSMLPTDFAGVPAYAQTNWNNFGRYGSLSSVVLTNSTGNTNGFSAQWDAGYADTTGTAAGLGTPDGKLMNGFLYSWGPGAATTLGNSLYNSSINNKPIVYLQGLNSWVTSVGAEGYSVVLYTTGYGYYETEEGWIQAVSGSPFNNTMVGGTDLTAHVFEQNTGPYLGTYTRATGTSAANQTSGANYMFFTGLTNDAILIRCQSGGYGAGLNAFQVVPIFPAPPTPSAPTFSPSDTVYAGVPVTLTEVATGDPFHPDLFYQWQNDRSGSGIATNNILNATNSTFTFTPTNNASPYTISYQVIVSNIFGASTSSVVTLNVNPAVAPFINQDTTPGPNVFSYVGGTVSFSASFGGTPATYLWQSNSVNLPGATNTTLTLANLQLSSSANYRLTATNSEGGAASADSTLTVLAAPAAPTSASPYAYDVFTNGPAAYWRFSETADNVANSIQAYDYSGHNLNATYGNGVLVNQPGPQSPAYVGFESTNIGVTLANNVPNSSLIAPSLNLRTNTVTITAWINPTTESAYNGLLTWVNGADKAGFGFGGNVNGSSMAELGYVWSTNNPATVNFHSGLFPPANQWSFVALTITPTNSTIYLYYVDGNTGITNLLKSVHTINNLAEPFSGGTTWIGSDTSANRNFNGTIDELAVFGKSLTEAQVQDLFLKSLGAIGVAPTVTDATIYPATSVYSGQNVRLTTTVNATAPYTVKWQSSPDSVTWTDVPGATSPSVVVNPLTVGTLNYRLVAQNAAGTGTGNTSAITFNALPATPAGLWTVNYQITNNVLNFTATSSGLGHYTGRGILGGGSYWNPMPHVAGAFTGANIPSVSDLRDDGTTHSGIYCTLVLGGAFSSASVNQPDSSDVGNLLNQMVQCYSFTNGLQFHGVPDGTYNVCFYGCDGTFANRGTTFVVHDALNGDQTAGTINAAPIVPLQQGNNFVVFSNVHVSGGTLNVDVLPTPVVPQYNPNTEADFNGAQIQLVSLDPVPPVVALTSTFNGSSLSLNWPQGILQTSTNLLGPWTPIYAPSPVSVPVTNSLDQFFRVQVR
jgi:hypothetical protein